MQEPRIKSPEPPPPADSSEPDPFSKLVSEASAHATEQDREVDRPKEPRFKRGFTLAVLIVVLAGSAFVTKLRLDRPVEIGTADQREYGAQALVFVTAVAVETFRSGEGRLPASLEEIGEGEAEVLYTRIDGGYRLEMTFGEAVAEYNSGDDLAPLRAAFESPPETIR